MTRASTWLQALAFLAASLPILFATGAIESKEQEGNFADIKGGLTADLKLFDDGSFLEPSTIVASEPVTTTKPSNHSTRPGLVSTFSLFDDRSDYVCYMNSVLTSLFAAVPFRSLIYRTNPVSVVMFFLVELFGSLQTATQPIKTDLFFRKSFKLLHPSWRFGEFQCSLEFAQELLKDLGPEVDQNLKITSTRYRILHTPESEKAFNDVVQGNEPLSALLQYTLHELKEENSYHQFMTCYKSVQDAFDKCFRDNLYQGRYPLTKLSEIDQREVDLSNPLAEAVVDVFDFTVIEDASEMFVMGLKRTISQDVFDNTRMDVEPEIVFLDRNCEVHTYKLQAFVHYWEAARHYVSYVCDYSENGGQGTWYLYNDSLVTVLQTQQEIDEMFEKAATCATFLVYVRSELAEKQAPDVPERYQGFVNLAETINDINSKNMPFMCSTQPFTRPNNLVKAQSNSSNLAANEPASAACPTAEENLFPNLHEYDYVLIDLDDQSMVDYNHFPEIGFDDRVARA